MDTAILLPLVDASAKLFVIFIERWSSSKGTDKRQTRVEAWLSKNYDGLCDAVTNNSIRLLAATEYGEGLAIASARKLLHPQLSLTPSKLKLFDKEFHYRLEYLVLLGLLQRGMREYHITRLGVAFLAMARTKGHYRDALEAK